MTSRNNNQLSSPSRPIHDAQRSKKKKMRKSETFSYQDVSSEKWSLPGSVVVVEAPAVVGSSAFINLAWIAISISTTRKLFDGKLLSFIAALILRCFIDSRATALVFTQKQVFSYVGFYPLFNGGTFHMQITVCLISESWMLYCLSVECLSLRVLLNLRIRHADDNLQFHHLRCQHLCKYLRGSQTAEWDCFSCGASKSANFRMK